MEIFRLTFNDYRKSIKDEQLGFKRTRNGNLFFYKENEDIVSTSNENWRVVQRATKDNWFSFNMTVLRPDDGKMVRLVSYDVIENEEENDGSTMVKGTENLNLLDDAELFKISDDSEEDQSFIGATEF